MINEEIQALVHRKGLDNMVVLKGEDVQRLLDMELPYNLLMDFVKRVAEYPYTEEQHRESMEFTGKAFERAWDHVVPGSLCMKASFALVALFGMVDTAGSLREMWPPASWEPEPADPSDG